MASDLKSDTTNLSRPILGSVLCRVLLCQWFEFYPWQPHVLPPRVGMRGITFAPLKTSPKVLRSNPFFPLIYPAPTGSPQVEFNPRPRLRHICSPVPPFPNCPGLPEYFAHFLRSEEKSKLSPGYPSFVASVLFSPNTLARRTCPRFVPFLFSFFYSRWHPFFGDSSLRVGDFFRSTPSLLICFAHGSPSVRRAGTRPRVLSKMLLP